MMRRLSRAVLCSLLGLTVMLTGAAPALATYNTPALRVASVMRAAVQVGISAQPSAVATVPFNVNGSSSGLAASTAVKLQTLSGSTWSDLSGATGTTAADGSFTIAATVATAGTTQIRAIVTGSSPVQASNTAVVAVTATGIQASAPATATVGTSFNVTVASAGFNSTPVKVQRYNGGWQDVAGATGTTSGSGAATIATTLNNAGPHLLRVVNTAGTAFSNTFNVQVNAAPAVSVTINGPKSATAGTAFNITGASTGTTTSTTVQVQTLVGGVWTNQGSTVNPAADGSFTAPVTVAATGTAQIRVLTGTPTATSNVLRVNVVSAASLTASAPGTVYAGEAFAITGSSMGLPGGSALKAQSAPAGSSTWTDISGATGTVNPDGSYKLNATLASAGAMQVRVTTTSGPTATSNAAPVTVQAARVTATITAPAQGGHVTMVLPFNVVGTTTNVTDATPIKVQRYVGTTWTDVPSATGTVTSNAFSIATSLATAGQESLRVMVGTTPSAPVTVIVDQLPRLEIIASAPVTATVGTAFNVTGQSQNVANLTAVKLQQYVGGAWTDTSVSGTINNNAVTLAVTPSAAGNTTYRIVTTAVVPPVASNPVTVAVKATAAINISAPGSAPVGQPFTITGQATGIPDGSAVKAQWNNAGTWTDIAGATGTVTNSKVSIATTVATAGMTPIRVVTTSGPAATSNTVTVNVTNVPSLTGGAPATVGSGNQFNVNVASTGLADGTSVKVQVWNGGWQDVPNATGSISSNAATIATTLTQQGPALLRVTTANGSVASANFNTTVGPNIPTGITASAPSTATNGTPFNVTVTSTGLAVNTGVKVQDCTAACTDVSGATGSLDASGNATIATTLTTNGARTLKVVSTSGPAAASNTFTVTVSAAPVPTITISGASTGTAGSSYAITVASTNLPNSTPVKVQDCTTTCTDVSGATGTVNASGAANLTVPGAATGAGTKKFQVVSTSPAATSNQLSVTFS